MISRNEIAKEVDTVWELTDNEIYERLGVSAMGSEDLPALSDSLGIMRSIAETTDGVAAAALLTNTLIKKGHIFFEGLWKKAREIICYVHENVAEVYKGKDLVTLLAGAVASALKISSGLAVLLVTMAIRIGLDKLCGGGAED